VHTNRLASGVGQQVTMCDVYFAIGIISSKLWELVLYLLSEMALQYYKTKVSPSDITVSFAIIHYSE